MSAIRGVAVAKRGTVRRTALCRWCSEVLYNDGWGWEHDLYGGPDCDEELLKIIDREREQNAAFRRRNPLPKGGEVR